MGEGRRTRSVGTKLTEEEYAKLEALAAQQGVTSTEQALLAELLALRTILINTV
jgi:hypothetical protein